MAEDKIRQPYFMIVPASTMRSASVRFWSWSWSWSRTCTDGVTVGDRDRQLEPGRRHAPRSSSLQPAPARSSQPSVAAPVTGPWRVAGRSGWLDRDYWAWGWTKTCIAANGSGRGCNSRTAVLGL